MKRSLIIFGAVVVSFVCIALIFKNLIIKSIVTMVSSRVIGAPVHIDGFSLNIVNSTIRITGFEIYNPEGFPQDILVFCPKINVIYDRATLFKPKRHFLLVEIDLEEIFPVKNKDGLLNVDSLKIVKDAKSSTTIPMQIDLVNLSIGRIIYKDYTDGPEPGVKVYNVNRSASYKGIPTAQELLLLVLAEPMKAALIKGAEIYGVAVFTGAAALPVAVVATLIGKDSVEQVIDVSFETINKVSHEVVERMGTITGQDVSKGVIKAKINGATVTLTLKKNTDHETQITISARKFLLPKLDIAGGVLYQIMDKLQ